MSLLDVQNFLAQVYTDENLRLEFLAAPEKIGKDNNLNEKEVAELAQVLPAELNFFADSLRWKRLREVEKLLPLIKKALAEDFEKYFREFANQFAPVSIKKHLEDAIGYAEFLQTRKLAPDWIKDLAKFEQAKLEFNGYGKLFVFKQFNFNIKEISLQPSIPKKEFKQKKTFAVWLRFRKQTRLYIW